jgi:taurine dioxygenase
VEVRDLTTSFGAVLEVDLRHPLDPLQQRDLREVFAARHLLLFREQDISFEDQARVVGYLGPVLAGGPEWVSNVRENGLVPEGALLFHSDFIFTAQPSLGLCLYATEVSPGGSPTNFADAVGAAGRLPSALRARVRGRRALNVFDLSDQRGDTRFREATLGPETPLSPRYAHPILMRHPTSGQELLSVNQMQTDRIIGLEARESEETLEALWALLYAPENTYSHQWRVGDLVLWDNIAVQHGRPAPPAGVPRTMRRVTMAEHSVFDLVPGFVEARAARREDAARAARREPVGD